MKMMKIISHNKKIKVIYTRLEEGKTLTKCGTVFFVNPQEFGVRLPWFLGLLKLEFHLGFDKKYFDQFHFHFVIFSLV